MAASEEYIKAKMTVTSIKKEKCKEPYELNLTGKFESNHVFEESGDVLKGTITFSKMSPLLFEDVKKWFGGLSDSTPLSLQIRRTPFALLDDFPVEGD